MNEIERTSTEVEKEGLFTGKYALNPFTGQEVPIWIANYVLVDYGTGAVMGVPAGDERDYKFAKNISYQSNGLFKIQTKHLILINGRCLYGCGCLS